MKSKRVLAAEKKYYLADLGFYFALNTDNRINFGPVLENYVATTDYTLQKRNGIKHVNLMEFIRSESKF